MQSKYQSNSNSENTDLSVNNVRSQLYVHATKERFGELLLTINALLKHIVKGSTFQVGWIWGNTVYAIVYQATSLKCLLGQRGWLQHPDVKTSPRNTLSSFSTICMADKLFDYHDVGKRMFSFNNTYVCMYFMILYFIQ